MTVIFQSSYLNTEKYLIYMNKRGMKCKSSTRELNKAQKTQSNFNFTYILSLEFNL